MKRMAPFKNAMAIALCAAVAVGAAGCAKKAARPLDSVVSAGVSGVSSVVSGNVSGLSATSSLPVSSAALAAAVAASGSVGAETKSAALLKSSQNRTSTAAGGKNMNLKQQQSSLAMEQAGSHTPEVYVGICDQFRDQLQNPTQWNYVHQNADGFYINFIGLNRLYSQNDLVGMANLFRNKNVLIESDTQETTEDKDKLAIDNLQAAGFKIPYTSLNYGWDATRQSTLKTYDLPQGQAPRYCFVQDGPWCIGGNILSDAKTNGVFTNAQYRSWIQQADGISTDGPMGLWKSNSGQMKQGSYSMVKYSHSLSKKALVMICPYGAGVSSYNTGMFLNVGEQCVRDHEDNDAEPDIWSVFEYATSFAAVPEQKNGMPCNSTTGMAYYLIKHIKGDPGTLDLYATSDSGVVTGRRVMDTAANGRQAIKLDKNAAAGTTLHYTLTLADYSAWLDYAAVLKSSVSGDSSAWKVQVKQGGTDVTSSVSGNGLEFYKTTRLNPLKTQTVDIYLTRTGSGNPADFSVNLQLLPHATSGAMDAVQLIAG